MKPNEILVMDITWVGNTQYGSATGKIIGGESAEDQQALKEVSGDMIQYFLNLIGVFCDEQI